ncbi:MAG TPA: MBL fold metallo-hydrolase [Gammaproteobacteria bacterium]|nr:MBL fold metallo-hydrolase [Gammaproteobacteria bacterium]
MGLRRREVLTGIAGAAASTLVARLGRAASGISATELGAGLVCVAGGGANVVALRATDGQLLVDGGSPSKSRELLDFLSEHGGGPPRMLFNTSWRDEHTGSNEALGAQRVQIAAHMNTKLWLGGDFDVDWEDRHYSPRPAVALPGMAFYTSGSLDFGGRKVEYRYLPRAHTDGDVAVFFPDVNVLAVGALLAVGAYPFPDYATGGWIGGLEAATRALLDATDSATKIVPAFGPTCGRAELEAQLKLCTAVKERVADAYRHGLSFKEFVATNPTQEFDAARGDPSLFLKLVHKGAWAHLRELGGVI